MARSEHDEEHSAQRRRFALLRREWQLSLYPQAAEAGGCLVTMRSAEAAAGDPDPERSRAEGARRARAKVRRYGVANRLNRLGSLTYAGEGCFDPVQLRQDVAAFFKALRSGLGGEALPYVWVPEWHPGGHGLHRGPLSAPHALTQARKMGKNRISSQEISEYTKESRKVKLLRTGFQKPAVYFVPFCRTLLSSDIKPASSSAQPRKRARGRATRTAARRSPRS